MTTTFQKRQKEMKRIEKRKMKEQKRVQRKIEKVALKESGQDGPQMGTAPEEEFDLDYSPE
jgi:hypothetical protein